MYPMNLLGRVLACVALPLALVACSGGEINDRTDAVTESIEAEPTGTGQVSVLVTDAPTRVFAAVNVTVSRITLIGRGRDNRHVLFEGEATLDLLQLENFTEFFSLSSDVPAGRYKKIRLHLTEVELVTHSGHRYYPPLFGRGVLDLKSRRPFTVEPDRLLVIEIDVDARRSVRLRRGRYGFRPVVMVKVGVEEVSHVVRVRGIVSEVDVINRSFRVCRIDDSNGGLILTDSCLTAKFDDDASVFNADGSPGDLAGLLDGEVVKVVGELDDDDPLVIAVDLVNRDASIGLVTITGSVASAPDAAASFQLALDIVPQGTDDPVIDVRLQDGTRLFDGAGAPLTAGDIAMGQSAEVNGILVTVPDGADVLWAQMAVLTDAEEPQLDLNGFVFNRTDRDVTLLTDAGTVCVRILPDADIQLSIQSSSGNSMEAGTIDDLLPGREVDLLVTEAADRCFEASSAVVVVIAD